VLNAIEARHPHERHYYLPVIGIRPEWQGRGFGSALLRPILERCDREVTPAYLETANPANLGLYERHGFAVRERLDLRDGLRVWTMLRIPRR